MGYRLSIVRLQDLVTTATTPYSVTTTAAVLSTSDSPLVSSTVSSLPMTISVTEVSQNVPLYVALSMKVLNVNYVSLHANTDMRAQFVQNVKEAIIFESGAGIAQEDVQVHLSAGSVIVQASIEPSSSAMSSLILTRLEASTTLTKTVVDQVSSVPGISSITSGSITAGELNVQGVQTTFTFSTTSPPSGVAPPPPPSGIAPQPTPPPSGVAPTPPPSSIGSITTSTVHSTTVSGCEYITAAPTPGLDTPTDSDLDDDEFDPLVFLIGASGLALGGLAGT